MSGNNSQDTNPPGDPLVATAKVGALCGVAGLIYGGAAGVIRARHPVVHSLSCGIHWFGCGSAYWWLRSNIIKLHFQDQASPQERAYVSALSGGLSGGVVTRLMGGRLVPGLVIFSLLGYTGQSIFNRVDAWQLQQAQLPSQPSRTIYQRMADSKWIPVRHLSDEDYRNILSEKLLGIEADIALLDEKIADLEASRPTPAPPAAPTK